MSKVVQFTPSTKAQKTEKPTAPTGVFDIRAHKAQAESDAAAARRIEEVRRERADFSIEVLPCVGDLIGVVAKIHNLSPEELIVVLAAQAGRKMLARRQTEFDEALARCRKYALDSIDDESEDFDQNYLEFDEDDEIEED